MRKGLSVLLALLMIVSLASCGSETPAKTPKPNYIGQRQVDWVESEKGWRLFWAFYEKEDGPEIKSAAKIAVTMKDENNNILLEKDYSVTEDNYSTWSNAIRGEHLLGSIFIPVNELKKGTSEDGTLSFTVNVGDEMRFDATTLSVYNLPLMDLDVSLPTLPLTVTQYGYNDKYEAKGEIKKIEFVYDYGWEGFITVTLTDHYEGENKSDYFEFNYRIVDDDGIVVDSGTVMTDKIRVGDTVKEKLYLSDLKLGKHYTLTFEDYHW